MHTGISGIIHLSCVVSLWIADTLLPTLYLIAEVKRRKRQSSGILQYIFSRKLFAVPEVNNDRIPHVTLFL